MAISQRLAVGLFLVAVPKANGQGEPPDCAVLARRMASRTWTTSETSLASRCPLTGPVAIADALGRFAVLPPADRRELVSAAGQVRDVRVFGAALVLARGHVAHRSEGASIVAEHVWPAAFEIRTEWLWKALPGQAPPRAVHEEEAGAGAAALSEEIRQASQLFYELASDTDSVTRRAGLVLRAAAARRWPEAAIIPVTTRVRISPRCGSPGALTVQANLDVPMEFEVLAGTARTTITLGGPSAEDVARGQLGSLSKPAVAVLRLPEGDVIVTRAGREFARLSAAARGC